MTRKSVSIAAVLALLLASAAFAEQTSETNPQLKEALAQYPEADANHDGILTMKEAREYLQKMRQGGVAPTTKPAAAPKAGAAKADATKGAGGEKPIVDNEAFKITAAELEKLMQADNVKGSKEPLSYPKGNGLRILMTGHSWVAPARVSLPNIAKAAGYDGHQQRSHTNGGGKGSAFSIWQSEIGKSTIQPNTTILLPAIATGQWDVMTWGCFLGDKPEHYEQWIDVCLKYNPNMIFFIQDGWPTYDKDAASKSTEQILAGIDEKQATIHKMMQELYDGLNAKYPGKIHVIVPGDAVTQILHMYYNKQLPEDAFDGISEHLGAKKGLYRDGGHLSANSGMAEIDGYCYYATLYKKSPESVTGYVPKGLSKEFDTILRKAAWNAVTHNPLSGVTDKNGNGIADEIEAASAGSK